MSEHSVDLTLYWEINMGYIRKHKESLRSGFELFVVMFFTIGIAPALMFLAGLN